MYKTNELVLFTASDGNVTLDVNLKDETVWLNRNQLSQLFDRDIKTIGKHINNVLDEELKGVPVVSKFATTGTDGKTYQVEYYNLDVIISVGYRVKSQRGIEFRRWANKVLKNYILTGYAINEDRLQTLGQVVKVLKQAQLDASQVLSAIEQYTLGLDLLDDYDHLKVDRPAGTQEVYKLSYDECRAVIDSMKFASQSDLFGNEKDDSFRASIGDIYQTFDSKDVYPTVQEKAAHLLYFLVKNHSFSDGNKRIGAALFLYFLDKNNLLFNADHTKKIGDYTLVALTIMIAESKPDEMELMISLVLNFLQGE